MTDKEDIRWIQRLENYCKALDELKREVELASERELSKLEKKGVIQSFEITQELSWKLLRDFLYMQGDTDIHGSRDAFALAFERGMVKNGKVLMESVKSRNLSAHTYNEETANDIFHKTIEIYYEAFEEIRSIMLQERQKRNS